MDQLLIDKLVTLKPVNWATTIARHEVVQKLHAKTRFSVPEMKSYAAKLDITPRYLYMLVRQYAAEVGGAPIREKTPGPRRTLDARCEKLIETTIAEIGLGATPNVIAKEVRERRSRDKLPYVSDMTVRHRISEIAGRDRLRNLFQKDCDYLLDACELGLRLKSEERGVGTAYIGGLFDIRNGALIAHRVTFEFPDAGEITRILSFIPAAETGGDARVGITTSVSAYGDEIRRTLRAEPVSLRRGLRKGGLGFRNFFGRRLGKLDFCGERREDTTCMKPVSPAEAEQVEGADELGPGMCANRVARLADGSLLNRYWDPRGTPRDESWREDVETAAGSERPPEDMYRDLRAGAESGWDFSSCWLDGTSLSSIRTTAIAPIDLNAFLFGLEAALAAGGDSDAPLYAARAAARRDAMTEHLWNEQAGHFLDYDIEQARARPQLSAAALAPLLSGIATQRQADAVARVTRDRLLAPGGLRTTLIDSGQQWDNPNGWAPLQWIAVAGLRRYGHHELAREISSRWIATVETTYAATGLLYEKYDIESPSVGRGGEYDPQTGFGWTNGVTADLIDDALADTMS